MASLEGDVMRSFVLACEVIKDQVMQNVLAAATEKRILNEGQEPGSNLKLLDKVIRDAVDQAARNSMIQLQRSLKPYAREIANAKINMTF
jgi:hypothetical protein